MKIYFQLSLHILKNKYEVKNYVRSYLQLFGIEDATRERLSIYLRNVTHMHTNYYPYVNQMLPIYIPNVTHVFLILKNEF